MSCLSRHRQNWKAILNIGSIWLWAYNNSIARSTNESKYTYDYNHLLRNTSMQNDTSPIPEQASTLSAQVYALVIACPSGRVTTYGALAKAVGYPRGARMVGWIM